MTASRLPPGPRYPAALGTLKFQRDLIPLLESAGSRYGDVWTLPVFGARIVFVADPELLAAMFEADPTVLHGAAIVAKPVLGSKSLLVLSEDAHSSLRGLMQPLFHRDRVQLYRDTIARICEEEIARWPLGEPMPLLPRLQEITLRVVMSVIFGVTEGERQERLRLRIRDLLTWGESPVHMAVHHSLFMLGLSPTPTFLRLRSRVDDLLLEEIGLTQRDPRLEERDDVLAQLVMARYEDGRPLTNRELHDQLMTLLIQGHHSTANAIAFAVERLLRHPDAFELLRAEAGTDSEEYVGAVTSETLRLFPPVPVVMRAVNKPYPVRGYMLEPGTMISANCYMLHRRPDLWPEPDRFLPERFLKEPVAKYTWVPFGGGARHCIGRTFATTEIHVVLRTLARSTRLAAPDPSDEGTVKHGVLLGPGRGTQAMLVERLPSAERVHTVS